MELPWLFLHSIRTFGISRLQKREPIQEANSTFRRGSNQPLFPGIAKAGGRDMTAADSKNGHLDAAEAGLLPRTMQNDLKYARLESDSFRIERQIDGDGKVFSVIEHNGKQIRRDYLGYIDKQTGMFRDVLQ
jgi:hypothetical protein